MIDHAERSRGTATPGPPWCRIPATSSIRAAIRVLAAPPQALAWPIAARSPPLPYRTFSAPLYGMVQRIRPPLTGRPRAASRAVPPDGPPVDGGPIADGGLVWHDLNAFQRDVLLAMASLCVTHPTGRRIGERLSSQVGREVGGSRLYQSLDSLVALELVRKRPGTADARTNEYRLTDAAAQLIHEHTRHCERVAACSEGSASSCGCSS